MCGFPICGQDLLCIFQDLQDLLCIFQYTSIVWHTVCEFAMLLLSVGEIFHTVWICNGLLVRFFIKCVDLGCSLWAIFARQCLYFQCIFVWFVGEIFKQ